MTKAEAAKEMFQYSRDLVSPIVMAGMIAPWTTLKKLKVNPRKLKSFTRALYHPDDANDPAYAVSEVVEKLALSLGANKYYSPFEGEGIRRDDIVKHYIQTLCDCTPLVPNSHHKSCPAVVTI